MATLAQRPPVTEGDPQTAGWVPRGLGELTEDRVSPQMAGGVPKLWSPSSRLKETMTGEACSLSDTNLPRASGKWGLLWGWWGEFPQVCMWG